MPPAAPFLPLLRRRQKIKRMPSEQASSGGVTSMEQIRAVVVDPSAPGRLAIKPVPGPSPLPSEAVVRVAAVSLNLGEVRRAMTADAGWRPGWDLAGTVDKAAADGSGPRVGTRVVGFVPSGAWAEE